METRLLLGGGGSEVEEYSIHELFASWVRPGPVLYLPIAMRFVGFSQKRWIQAALKPHGIDQIEIWDSLDGHPSADLEHYRGIFIGGGNTFHLIHQLRVSGFDIIISNYISNGGVVYGGSAGAIIMGKNISPCAHIDSNEDDLTDLRGLNILDGDSVWCHYQIADEELIKNYVKSSRSTTFALPESGGLWVRGRNDYLPLGSGQILRFDLEGKYLHN